MNTKKFRVEKEEYVNRTFRLSKKMVDKLDKICDEKGISLNKLVVLCVEYALENMDDQ